MATQKLTVEKLHAFVKGYVDPLLQAGEFEAGINTFTGLVKKIAVQVMLDGYYGDKLPEFDGMFLPYGKTIEEYFIDLPVAVKKGAANDYTSPFGLPKLTFEEAAYSYDLGTVKIAVNFPYNEVEEAMLNADTFSNLVVRYMERLANSETLYRYAGKKQLLHNNIVKAIAADTANGTNLVQTVAKPVDATTGTAFIKKVKDLVEDAQFVNEGNNLANTLIGASPSLTLYIKKGIKSTIDVETLAGAFHLEKLAVPCEIKVLDDFGSDGASDAEGYVDTSDVYAILIDPRSIKLHPTYNAMREQIDANADEINYVKHLRFTGFISKYTYVKVFKDVAGE